MSDLFDVSGRTVLVTGSTRGLGLILAKGFAQRGAGVIVNSRNAEDVQGIVKMLKHFNDNSTGACFDVSCPDAVRENISLIEKKTGGIDVLVNNAGIQRRAPFLEMSREKWREVVDVNLSSVFTVSQAVAAGMAKRKSGRIINISSLNSVGARPTISNYCAAKGGLNMLTKAMATELGQHGINVNAIAPGYFITDMTKHLAQDAEFDKWVKSETALGRWGEPEDLIGTAVFLASDASEYITGQVIFVEGGWRASL